MIDFENDELYGEIDKLHIKWQIEPKTVRLSVLITEKIKEIVNKKIDEIQKALCEEEDVELMQQRDYDLSQYKIK